MDARHLPEPCAEKRVRIVGSELVESYTVYIIEVYVGDHSWTVKHRYSDFHDLHEKLTVEKKIDKHLLPPKKIIGKNSKSLVEKRQKELEVYLQTLLSRFPASTPKVLSNFLLFHLYEISGIAAALAEELFHKGEQLLAAGEVFLLRPLQLYAVTQQLKLAKPTCANGDAKADLGHILDFTCRLKYLKIPGMKAAVGTSNIEEQSLPFDLSIFKSLLQIEISDCDAGQIKGLPSLKPTLATLSIHLSASSMKEILVPEASEFAQWEPEGVDTDCPVTAIIPTWNMLTTLDMSRNFIRCIDESVKLIPEVEFLDLSYNELSLVENLQHLYNLVHLDLSFNKLTVLEGVHTKLGNIKTLNLSGNQLETLSGLSKLYSLVNLDLSSNKLAQLDEIKNICTLPCLEKLSLADNPMCIIPDYRTKVLAQFCDRASEVCLDGTTTTEKELDTVEVLKAIQKAKEAKDRMANNEKKVSDVQGQAAGGPQSSSSSLVAPPSSSSPSLSRSTCSSQEITTCKEKAFITKEILTPVDSTLTQRCYDVYSSACDIIPQVKTQIDSSLSSEVTFESSPCCCEEEWKHWTANLSNLFVPPPLLSYATTNQEFTNQLSAHISQANIEESTPIPCKTTTLEGTDQGSPQSGDGYFEMTIDDTNEIMGCSSSSTIQENMPDDVKKESAIDNVKMVVWSLCISVGEGLSQRPSCLVATDSSLVVFHTRSEEPVSTLEELIENLETDLVVPYTNIETFQFDIPEVCLSFKVKSSNTRWFFFSGAQSLKEMHSCIVPHVDQTNEQVLNSSNTQVFIRRFLNSWDFEESEGSVKGGHLIHFLDLDSSTSDKNVANNPQFPKNSATLDVLSQIGLFESGQSQTSNPMILFLTSRHLCILKVDFVTLASRDPSEASAMRSCSKVTRIPLSFTLLDPKQDCSCRAVSDSRRFYNEHVVELMAGHERLTVVFALPQDKFTFQIEFTQLRSNLREIKTIALQRTKKGHLKVHSCPAPATATERIPTSSVPQEVPRPHLTLSLLYPAKSLIQQLMEDNQCPSHFSLSSSLLLISSLKGDQLVHFFHDNIAEMENEELKHILWTSVLFYRSPDVETTACVLLSTKAIYFVLDDTASSLTNQSMMWTWNPSEHKDTDFLFSFCFTLKLKDLQSVNVGLFDQYFRVVGPSADHIISCLTRDGYGTHRFLQQLMMVLSLLEKVPSPEPSELDFYSQFGNKSTGKMENYELVHSSKVKFVYPSEEEIGDLTFIVAERKTPQAPSHSFNILLYVLVFQVHVVPGQTAQNQTVLQPKTLILTSTDVFLLDEDHISYPLPEFAKEPPQRDKYRLTDARRIRDLDRVLMGYQTYPQALTLVFDDVPGPDLLCHLTMDHFAESDGKGDRTQGVGGAEGEVQWCIFVPGADSRERLISLLARQWETLCSRELPVELTG
ncbi:nischarin [Sinocyclocheilus anshuiensis]|uniref:PX domain-containing protein n=2 Tax=Cyprinidae TaxID=7953 RepID=A0A671Q4Q2_9TELE|nr:PREDICTED: nischarin [Sinocyclocheilus anshuiensis]